MISHIVLFKPKSTVTAADTVLFAQQLQRTIASVPVICRASIGRKVDINIGHDRRFGDMAYEYSAVLEFESKEDLVAYLQHPSHQELGRLFWDYCEAAVVSEVESVDAKANDITGLLGRAPN